MNISQEAGIRQTESKMNDKLVERVARAIQRQARIFGDDSPVDFGDAEYLAKAAIEAAGVGELVEHLQDIKLSCEEAAYASQICEVSCGPVKAVNEIYETASAAIAKALGDE